MKTLIVEDHTLFREMLHKVCQLELHLEVVAEAASGHVAIAQIHAHHPELVILDIFLPDITGFEVVQATQSLLSRPRFLAVSGQSDPHILHRIEQQGFDGYIDKCAATLDRLQTAVSALSEGRPYWTRLRELLDHGQGGRHRGPALALNKLLSSREMQILRLIGYSLTDEEIAHEIRLSASTVQSFRSHIMKKLQINGTPKLINFALTHGITDLNCARCSSVDTSNASLALRAYTA